MKELNNIRNFIERYFVKQVEEYGIYHREMKQEILKDLDVIENKLRATNTTCKKIGLVCNNKHYALVNTSLFPYDKDSDEECKKNLISSDLLEDLKITDKVIDLLETLSKDSEKNGDGKGAYYRSAIPYIKALKENNNESNSN